MPEFFLGDACPPLACWDADMNQEQTKREVEKRKEKMHVLTLQQTENWWDNEYCIPGEVLVKYLGGCAEYVDQWYEHMENYPFPGLSATDAS